MLVSLCKLIERLRVIEDVEKTLVRTDLELIAGFLVYVWTTQNGELLNLVGKRDRATNLRAGALCSVHDFLSACVQHTVIKSLQPNANVLTLHFVSLF